jgi:Flp pilus assembly pilin Flp
MILLQLLELAISRRLARMHGDRGQTMAEYGALLAVIALIVVIAAALLGANLSSIFDTTARKT